MIPAIVIPLLYVIIGLVVARWTALRRMKNGKWNDPNRLDDLDNHMACALALFGWPVATLMYFVTRPPRATRLERAKKQVEELERELGMQP